MDRVRASVTPNEFYLCYPDHNPKSEMLCHASTFPLRNTWWTKHVRHWVWVLIEASCKNICLCKRNKMSWKQKWEIETAQTSALPVSRGPRLLPSSSMAAFSLCPKVPAIDSLFSLPLIWLMNQHDLNCFIAACVYFTHTLTFLFLLLLAHTYASKQQQLAVSLWIARMQSYLANSSGLDPWPFDWGLILFLWHLTI